MKGRIKRSQTQQLPLLPSATSFQPHDTASFFDEALPRLPTAQTDKSDAYDASQSMGDEPESYFGNIPSSHSAAPSRNPDAQRNVPILSNSLFTTPLNETSTPVNVSEDLADTFSITSSSTTFSTYTQSSAHVYPQASQGMAFGSIPNIPTSSFSTSGFSHTSATSPASPAIAGLSNAASTSGNIAFPPRIPSATQNMSQPHSTQRQGSTGPTTDAQLLNQQQFNPNNGLYQSSSSFDSSLAISAHAGNQSSSQTFNTLQLNVNVGNGNMSSGNIGAASSFSQKLEANNPEKDHLQNPNLSGYFSQNAPGHMQSMNPHDSQSIYGTRADHNTGLASHAHKPMRTSTLPNVSQAYIAPYPLSQPQLSAQTLGYTDSEGMYGQKQDMSGNTPDHMVNTPESVHNSDQAFYPSEQTRNYSNQWSNDANGQGYNPSAMNVESISVNNSNMFSNNTGLSNNTFSHFPMDSRGGNQENMYSQPFRTNTMQGNSPSTQYVNPHLANQATANMHNFSNISSNSASNNGSGNGSNNSVIFHNNGYPAGNGRMATLTDNVSASGSLNHPMDLSGNMLSPLSVQSNFGSSVYLGDLQRNGTMSPATTSGFGVPLNSGSQFGSGGGAWASAGYSVSQPQSYASVSNVVHPQNGMNTTFVMNTNPSPEFYPNMNQRALQTHQYSNDSNNGNYVVNVGQVHIQGNMNNSGMVNSQHNMAAYDSFNMNANFNSLAKARPAHAPQRSNTVNTAQLSRKKQMGQNPHLLPEDNVADVNNYNMMAAMNRNTNAYQSSQNPKNGQFKKNANMPQNNPDNGKFLKNTSPPMSGFVSGSDPRMNQNPHPENLNFSGNIFIPTSLSPIQLSITAPSPSHQMQHSNVSSSASTPQFHSPAFSATPAPAPSPLSSPTYSSESTPRATPYIFSAAHPGPNAHFNLNNAGAQYVVVNGGQINNGQSSFRRNNAFASSPPTPTQMSANNNMNAFNTLANGPQTYHDVARPLHTAAAAAKSQITDSPSAAMSPLILTALAPFSISRVLTAYREEWDGFDDIFLSPYLKKANPSNVGKAPSRDKEKKKEKDEFSHSATPNGVTAATARAASVAAKAEDKESLQAGENAVVSSAAQVKEGSPVSKARGDAALLNRDAQNDTQASLLSRVAALLSALQKTQTELVNIQEKCEQSGKTQIHEKPVHPTFILAKNDLEKVLATHLRQISQIMSYDAATISSLTAMMTGTADATGEHSPSASNADTPIQSERTSGAADTASGRTSAHLSMQRQLTSSSTQQSSSAASAASAETRSSSAQSSRDPVNAKTARPETDPVQKTALPPYIPASARLLSSFAAHVNTHDTAKKPTLTGVDCRFDCLSSKCPRYTRHNGACIAANCSCHGKHKSRDTNIPDSHSSSSSSLSTSKTSPCVLTVKIYVVLDKQTMHVYVQPLNGPIFPTAATPTPAALTLTLTPVHPSSFADSSSLSSSTEQQPGCALTQISSLNSHRHDEVQSVNAAGTDGNSLLTCICNRSRRCVCRPYYDELVDNMNKSDDNVDQSGDITRLQDDAIQTKPEKHAENTNKFSDNIYRMEEVEPIEFTIPFTQNTMIKYTHADANTSAAATESHATAVPKDTPSQASSEEYYYYHFFVFSSYWRLFLRQVTDHDDALYYLQKRKDLDSGISSSISTPPSALPIPTFTLTLSLGPALQYSEISHHGGVFTSAGHALTGARSTPSRTHAADRHAPSSMLPASAASAAMHHDHHHSAYSAYHDASNPEDNHSLPPLSSQYLPSSPSSSMLAFESRIRQQAKKIQTYIRSGGIDEAASVVQQLLKMSGGVEILRGYELSASSILEYTAQPTNQGDSQQLSLEAPHSNTANRANPQKNVKNDPSPYPHLWPVLPYHCYDSQTAMARIGLDLNETDGYGRTLLMFACVKGLSDVAQFCLKYGTNIYTIDKFGQTCLLYALKNKHHLLSEYLLLYPMDVNQINHSMFCSLVLATMSTQTHLVSMIIDRGANVDIKIRGKSILLFSVIGKHQDISALLVRNNAALNELSLQGTVPKSVMQWAIDKNMCNLVLLMLNYGAQIKYHYVKGKNDDLEPKEQEKFEEDVPFEETSDERRKNNKKKNAEKNRDKKSNSDAKNDTKNVPQPANCSIPDDNASENGSIISTQTKVKTIDAHQTPNSDGKSEEEEIVEIDMVAYAIKHNNSLIVRNLCENGNVDVHWCDSLGRNYIMFSALHNKADLVSYFINKGVDVYQVSKVFDETLGRCIDVFDVAQQKKHNNVLLTLEPYVAGRKIAQ